MESRTKLLHNRKGEIRLGSLTTFIFILFVLILIFLLLHRDKITFNITKTFETIEWATNAASNGDLTAVITNSEKTITVINKENQLVYTLKAKPHSANSFSNAELVALDLDNNLYVLDKRFGGIYTENVERIIQFSPSGSFVQEIYAHTYLNEDFILTRGKLCALTYHDDVLYFVRLEREGFFLEQVDLRNPGESEILTFYAYPEAFRNVLLLRINVPNKRLTLTTKIGNIKHYDFSGGLIAEYAPGGGQPFSVISDGDNNIIYTDILTGEIRFIDVGSGERSVLWRNDEDSSEGTITQVNLVYAYKTLLAVYNNSLLVKHEGDDFEQIDYYTYTPGAIGFHTVLFILCVLDTELFILFLVLGIIGIAKKHFSDTFRRIIIVGIGTAFGVVISSTLLINEMTKANTKSIFDDLEAISHLMSSALDIKVLKSLESPLQYESETYQNFSNQIRELFSQLPFEGKRVYQYIWQERNGIVYSLYDSESALGLLFPFFEYADSYLEEVAQTKEYVRRTDATPFGSWLFTCGPILDEQGKVVAMLETGFNMNTVEEEIRSLILQTVLMVVAGSVAFLLLMIELILILNAYELNKLAKLDKKPVFYPKQLRRVITFLHGTIKKIEAHSSPPLDKTMLIGIANSLARSYNKYIQARREGAGLPFRPELPRALIFFLFFTNNLASPILPMYATNLYEPFLNLPRELVVTLPFIADTSFAALALLVIPHILETLGIKRISLIAAFLLVAANGLCLIAPNTLYLAIAYALIGFSGGGLLLVLNTVIGAQKKESEVNSGFAHFNASYLAGMNVGVVFGSILAQFFPYRGVFLFSSITALLLFFITLFSLRSKTVNYMYEISYVKDTPGGTGARFAFLKFIFHPLVLCALFMLLLPYGISMSFTNYFMPIYGTAQGLRESNIGQLILVSGLLAILFGTSLCKYVLEKSSPRIVIIASLSLNLGALYLFATYPSVLMLIITIVLLSIANIFVLTNVQTYYVSLYQNFPVSSVKALSVYSAMENLSMAIGPVVFSYILAGAIGLGMKLFSGVLLVCLLVFTLVSALVKTHKKA